MRHRMLLNSINEDSKPSCDVASTGTLPMCTVPRVNDPRLVIACHLSHEKRGFKMR